MLRPNVTTATGVPCHAQIGNNCASQSLLRCAPDALRMCSQYSPGVSWQVYVAVFVVMVVASTVQSSVGMGQGLLSAPLLRLLHPELLPGPIVFAGFLTSVVLVIRNSQRSDVRETLPAIAGRIVGIGIAIGLLAILSEQGLTLTIGGIVLLMVALRLIGLKIERTPRTLAGAGVASGIGGTIAALGGAPLGLLFEQHARARDFRGPMGVIMAVGGAITVVSLSVAGEIDREGWLLGLALLPPVVLGWLLARWVTPIVDRGLLGPAVLIMSAGSASALILGELL